MAVEGVMVSYNYSEDEELANILTVSASGIRFSKRWVLTHGSILSPLKEAKVIQNAKGKAILNDAFYENLPEIHVTCEKDKSEGPTVYETVERLSRERDRKEMQHSSYQMRVITGRIVHIWQCSVLEGCVDDILYSWSIGHRDGDVADQTQLGKALLSVFVLVDLQTADTGRQLKLKWRNIRDCFVKVHKSRMGTGESGKKKDYLYYENLLFLANDVQTPLHLQQQIKEEDLTGKDAEVEPDNEDKVWSRQSISESDKSNDFNNLPVMYSDDVTQIEYDSIEDPLTEEQLRSKRNKDVDSNGAIKLTDIQIQMDDATLFFLSLVKEFKKIPEKDQMQTKLDILKRIQSGQRMS